MSSDVSYAFRYRNPAGVERDSSPSLFFQLRNSSCEGFLNPKNKGKQEMKKG